MNNLFKIVAVSALSFSSAAHAEGELYYGLSFGVAAAESVSEFGETSANDLSIGGMVGYAWPLQDGNSVALEGTLDLVPGEEFEYADGQASCTDRSPDWCDLDAILRIRGVYSSPVSADWSVQSMAGLAVARGLAEDGPGNYVDSTATGYTLGLGMSRPAGNGTVRLEMNYDRLENVSPDAFSKELEIISVKASYVF